MIVRVLGSAAGGGVPQWNCACTNCTAARAGAAPRRSQSSIAVSADGDRWYLVNASPDVAQQIEAYEPLLPRTARGTPIAGAFFTDANVDHLGGLAVLRQQGNHAFVLRSSAAVRALAAEQVAFSAFVSAPHRWETVPLDGGAVAPVDRDEPFGSTLEVRALAVPGVLPGYAGRVAAAGAVVAYAFRDLRSNARALFAPVFATIDDGLRAELERADVVFLDGSFYRDDELEALGLGDKRATALGHLPVGGEGGSLTAAAALGGRRIFTHLNNSNPLLDPASPEALAVARAGGEVAYDGMELHL